VPQKQVDKTAIRQHSILIKRSASTKTTSKKLENEQRIFRQG